MVTPVPYYPFIQACLKNNHEDICLEQASIALKKALKSYRKAMREDGLILKSGKFKNVAAREEFERYETDLMDDWRDLFLIKCGVMEADI